MYEAYLGSSVVNSKYFEVLIVTAKNAKSLQISVIPQEPVQVRSHHPQNSEKNLEHLKYVLTQNAVTVHSKEYQLPVEVTVIGALPKGSGKAFIESAMAQQELHPTFADEWNETSALIGTPSFSKCDPTAVYTFAVDTRPLVWHRHAGHRIIMGVTGKRGCVLKFSTWSPEDSISSVEAFKQKLFSVEIAADSTFVLRFDGNIYH